MTKVLYVEASPRKTIATSTAAADIFVSALKEAGKMIEVDHLDLWNADLPKFDGARIAAKYAKLAGREMNPDEADAWRQISALVARFAEADAIVVATPMWNFGIPYRLKHWIDLIAQPGLTFTFNPASGYSPVVRPRPVLVILSSAGDYSEGPSYGRPDLATPYLQAVLTFLGLGPIFVEKIGPTAGPPEVAAAANARAIDRIRACATTFPGHVR